MPPDAPEREPGRRGRARRSGRTPRPEHDQVGGSSAGRGVHGRGPPSAPVSISATPSASTSRRPWLRTASATSPPTSGSSVPIGVRGTVDDGDVQPAHLAGLGHLQPDVAAADDHHPLHARRRPRGAQRGAVVEGLHAVDPGRVDARHLRARAGRAGGEHEVVEARRTRGRPRGRGPARAAGQVDPDDLGARCARRCRCCGAARACGPRAVSTSLDRTADPVRDAAGRVRGVPAALEGDDLQLVRAATLARLARGAHPRRVATDHDQPSAHGGNASPTAGAARCVPVSGWTSRAAVPHPGRPSGQDGGDVRDLEVVRGTCRL